VPHFPSHEVGEWFGVAPCHTSLLVKWANGLVLLRATLPFSSISSCRTKKITVRQHPPYSTDLAPCDFWLFPKLKLTMKGKRFASIPDIEAATTTRLK
jgi:hypothetical protein